MHERLVFPEISVVLIFFFFLVVFAETSGSGPECTIPMTIDGATAVCAENSGQFTVMYMYGNQPDIPIKGHFLRIKHNQNVVEYRVRVGNEVIVYEYDATTNATKLISAATYPDSYFATQAKLSGSNETEQYFI